MSVEKDIFLISIARSYSKAGKCSRKQVGAIVVVDGTVVAQGWNGSPRGTRHCDHETLVEADGEGETVLTPGDMENGHCALAAHAECNCIANAAREGISVKGGTLYVTVQPCFRPCAALIVNAGIRRIVYEEAYRPDPRAIALYQEAGIDVDRLEGGTIETIVGFQIPPILFTNTSGVSSPPFPLPWKED